MSKKLLNLCMTALFGAVSTAAWALSEVGGVYQIGTAADLKAFAELVNEGNPYLNAVLTADIDKGTDGTMIGCAECDYEGTFDGQGHTVTLNMFSEGTDGTALFRNIGRRAIVQNLKVQGTITTDKKYAAGIAVWSRGIIRGCYTDVSVTSALSGDCTHGGIVGVAYQGTIVENCLAKFVITGATTQNCGGLVGWASDPINIVNSLAITDGSSFDLSNNGSGAISRNDGNLRVVNLEEYVGNEYEKRPSGATYNNFATQNWGNNKATTIVAYEDLADGHVCYQLNNDQSEIAWVQTIGTDPFPVPAASVQDASMPPARQAATARARRNSPMPTVAQQAQTHMIMICMASAPSAVSSTQSASSATRWTDTTSLARPRTSTWPKASTVSRTVDSSASR